MKHPYRLKLINPENNIKEKLNKCNEDKEIMLTQKRYHYHIFDKILEIENGIEIYHNTKI